MIFYHIQAHDDFDYCLHLLSMIYSPENYYYVSIDAAARGNYAPLIDAATRLDNVQIDRTKSVTWAGISLLNAVMVALRRFVDGPAHCSWFVNISGLDIPLKTQPQMMARLDGLSKKGVEACVNFGEQPDLSQVRYFVEQMAPHEAPRVWQPGPGVWQPQPTVSLVVDRRIAHCFDPGHIPYFDRFGIFAFDDTPAKRFIVRPLREIEAMARRELFKRRPFRNGKAWHCLSRTWAKAMFAHPDFPAVASVMSSLLLPDEMMVQTMAVDSDADLDGNPKLLRDNLRFRSGDPVPITDAHYDVLFASDALFARKISLVHAPRVLERCAAICAREIKDFRNRLATPEPRRTVPAALARPAGQPAPGTLEIDRIYAFHKGAEGVRTLESGWSAPEDWGVWSNGDYARIAFAVPEALATGAGPVRCVLRCAAYIEGWVTMQRLDILANGNRVHSGLMLDSYARELVFDLSRDVIGAGRPVVLEFLLPNAAATRTVAMKGSDDRPIALSLFDLVLHSVRGG